MEQWYERRMIARENRYVVKQHAPDGRFLGSVVVPSVMYPLNGAPEIFTFQNTQIVKDPAVLRIIDAQTYDIGRCYTNASGVTGALQAAGYAAKTYCGWMFTSESRTPIHHCWTVLDGKSVIDLADDFKLMLCEGNREKFESVRTAEERTSLLISFQKWAALFPNHLRCGPVGCPTNFVLYIGCPCEAKEGISIYNNLTARFPDHPSHPAGGINPTQRAMREAGLMEWTKT